MTKSEIQTSVRSLCNEISADAGAFLEGEGNLDDFINDAAEIVVLDLVDFIPSTFLESEDISLVAGTAAYNMNNEYLQIWTINRNQTGFNPTPINNIGAEDALEHMYVGETAEEPSGWFFKKNQIQFVPTPSANKTTYIKVWFVASESAKIASGGPTYIPKIAHRLIVYMACILVGMALEANVSNFQALYKYRLDRVRRILGPRAQNQPRFVNPSVAMRHLAHEKERAFYDEDPFFGR